jgi:RNA polymerase sigma-70 factor (ECF subfamily)
VDQLQEQAEAEVGPLFVEGLRRGSAECFECFYRIYSPRIHAFARRRVANAAEADDLTQEIFLAVMRSIESYRERASFESWVFGVARNKVHEYIRSQQRRRAREALAESGYAPPTPEERLAGRRMVETLNRRLAAVDSWQAEAFALRYVERLPPSEIARRTERTPHQVRTSLERLRRRMANDLDL